MKICLCGSVRFEAEYHTWAQNLTLKGHLVSMPAMFGTTTEEANDKPNAIVVDDKRKTLLCLLHLIKFEEAEAILVINKDGYIGEQTKMEIMWAKLKNKEVFYLEISTEFSINSDRDIKELMSFRSLIG